MTRYLIICIVIIGFGCRSIHKEIKNNDSLQLTENTDSSIVDCELKQYNFQCDCNNPFYGKTDYLKMTYCNDSNDSFNMCDLEHLKSISNCYNPFLYNYRNYDYLDSLCNNLIGVDSLLFYKIYDSKYDNGRFKRFFPLKIYSYHDNLKLKAFTCLEYQGDGFPPKTILKVIGKNGKIVNSIEISSAYGDAGYMGYINTRFINDSTFIRIKYDFSPITNTRANVDSVINVYSIRNDFVRIIKSDSIRKQVKCDI